MDTKKDIKQQKTVIGQIFTPDHIAKFMVSNVLELLKSLNYEDKFNIAIKDLKVLDPTTGEGVFLKYLLGNNLTNITAYEIDNRLKSQLVKNYPNVQFRFENFLGSDINEKFDVIIGNPPYLGQNYNAKVFQNLIKNYPFCREYFVGNMDLFYFFIHLGIIMLKPGGILSYITTNYWITKSKKTGIKLLKPHILDECFLIQYIDLSRIRVFRDALGQHNCIFSLQKKTENDKLIKTNRKIEVVQISSSKPQNQFNDSPHTVIFETLNHSLKPYSIRRYQSALTNKELNSKSSWNLLYPIEVKNIVDKIKSFCIVKGKMTFLKDCFIIRNGLILIKDEIFILNPNENLKFRNNEVFVKIKGEFVKLNEEEKKRLKKIYKSKSIKPYGYEMKGFRGYLIYLNKEEFPNRDKIKRNEFFIKKYPALTSYLLQYKEDLEKILKNAKENVNDLYFPRRGSFIIRNGIDTKRIITNLEPFYDKNHKIFFKYISNENVFGYSEDSYYATSDTYFLWPKDDEMRLDFLFLIAYLNSKLVNFLFKANNISIKRSKTKLEDQLYIPNLKIFQSEEEVSKISLIKLLAVWMIRFTNLKKNHKLKGILEKILGLELFSKGRNMNLLNKIFKSIEQNNQQLVQEIIDKLLFELFDLVEEEIDLLIEKYY